MLKPQTLGNRSEETNLQTQPAAGNKSVREGVNPFGRRKLEFQNMQISDSVYLEKVFKNIKKN